MARVGMRELVVVGAVVAVLAVRGFKVPLVSPSVDWREVTVQGFPAGVTPKQLEEQLGPPELDHGTAAWPKAGIRFFQDQDGFHLAGDGIQLGSRTVARRPIDFMADTLRRSQLQALLGRGESIMEPNNNPDWDEGKEFESGLRYRAPDRQLRVDLFAPHPYFGVDQEVVGFDLSWGPSAAAPVIEGYTPGPTSGYLYGVGRYRYAIYPDRNGPLFCCIELLRNGRPVVRSGASPEQVLQSLGQPVAKSAAKELWGYWKPEQKLGILVEFDPLLSGVETIQVARDWRLLAAELSRADRPRAESTPSPCSAAPTPPPSTTPPSATCPGPAPRVVTRGPIALPRRHFRVPASGSGYTMPPPIPDRPF